MSQVVFHLTPEMSSFIDAALPEVRLARIARNEAVREHLDSAAETAELIEEGERALRRWASALEGDSRLDRRSLDSVLPAARADAQTLAAIRRRWGRI